MVTGSLGLTEEDKVGVVAFLTLGPALLSLLSLLLLLLLASDVGLLVRMYCCLDDLTGCFVLDGCLVLSGRLGLSGTLDLIGARIGVLIWGLRTIGAMLVFVLIIEASCPTTLASVPWVMGDLTLVCL